VEQQLIGFIRKAMKPCIFVVNKWDTMVGQMPTERCESADSIIVPQAGVCRYEG
jgi:predicted GTPase